MAPKAMPVLKARAEANKLRKETILPGVELTLELLEDDQNADAY